MKHNNIPIFIPELACPHRCIFCNQNKISGVQNIPKPEEITNIIEKYLSTIPLENHVEIAFFGGSFTGIPLETQEKYLKEAFKYIVNKKVKGIRLSTRPDYISKEILDLLKKYGVTTLPVSCVFSPETIQKYNVMIENYTLFFTATIVKWYNLLKPDKYKTIITESLNFLTVNKRVKIYAFVIMPNHIHLVWRILEPNLLKDVQRDFLKFTSQMIKTDLEKNHTNVLLNFKSKRKDRKYQFWQDNSYNKMMYNRQVLEQKIDYIHCNPISKKWNLTDVPENYKYSSAAYYSKNDTIWTFLTHISEEF